jgi:hypothetical protein
MYMDDDREPNLEKARDWLFSFGNVPELERCTWL